MHLKEYGDSWMRLEKVHYIFKFMQNLLYKIYSFIIENKLISLLIFISFISSLRTLFLPLVGDEQTYAEIAKNIMLHGEYSYHGIPSTITPSLPFLIGLFYTQFDPEIGFLMARISNFIFIIVGLRFLYLFLKRIELLREILICILLLTIVNSNFVLWSLMLYPESILFCFIWIFLYFITKQNLSSRDLLFITVSLGVLIITRYVFAVLLLLVTMRLFTFVKVQMEKKNYFELKKIFVYSCLSLLPLLFWFKYVYNLEKEVDTGLSYFNRFKEGNIFDNIKAGIGLLQHPEAGNVNGIPAFVTLFLPITALRSWILSIILLVAIILGYIRNMKEEHYNTLGMSIILIMAGLIFAGTGFSRYWLPMLPGFLLGFYLFFKQLKLKDPQFVFLAKIAAVIYVINELRLDILIFNKL